jgi:hypothetical protein
MTSIFEVIAAEVAANVAVEDFITKLATWEIETTIQEFYEERCPMSAWWEAEGQYLPSCGAK